MTVHRIPRQKTCAVVGNSGILLNSSCGDEINSNDFVIRCNIPEIEGFSRDVGNKTNVTNINLTRVKDIHKAMEFKKAPTAGMLTIGVAVCLCDKVSVYGFYPFPAGPDGRFVPYHYFGEFTNITAGSFKTRYGFHQEYLILQKWHQEGLINFVFGSCIT
ncbi:CMP-N-acetylneuraminate-poly-alpha-2,8-sialyltransferase-like [Saccoglossus kowalevskii]|uniref:Alpha-2,8-sialyltransferase 8F-like n=1 Tax=Saccoglossus kowalevskii TaxID=10224 RepID=A0ABM0MWG0_SACKO|nr:PREDICTED: alpha-2,8-sialyltransferase 8F-like [Saccoglossus kowalevskii]